MVRRWLFLAFLLLAVIYGVVNPIFEAPDEIQHFYYVRHIVQTGHLPIQAQQHLALYRQEGSQPPLYYLLGAALTFWVDTQNAESVVRENPHVNLGLPLAFGNKNAVIHTDAERFPYHGVPLAVHVLRFLSAVLGALSVGAAWTLACEVAPDQPLVAPLAAAFVAFLPQFLFISAAVNNDVAVAATCGWAAVHLVRGVQRGFDLRRAILLGMWVGLAALSKLSGLTMLPLVLMALTYVAWRHRDVSTGLRHGAVVLAVAVLVGGWWYARNLVLYGDILGLRVMLDVAGWRTAFSFWDFFQELEGLRLSFWGVFGWFNILADRAIYWLYDLLALVAFVGLFIKMGISLRSPRGRRQLVLIIGLLAWLLAVVMALVGWIWSTTGSQGRLVFPALPGIAVLWAMGIHTVLPHTLRHKLVAVLVVLLFGLAAFIPFRYLQPVYAPPIPLVESDLPPGLNRLDIDFGGKMRLIGYEMPERRIRRGTPLPLILYWQALTSMDRDYSVFVHVFGREGQAVGQVDTFPGGGNLPTTQWWPGEIIRDEYRVLVDPSARAPTLGTVDVGVYDVRTQERLIPMGPDGRLLERVMLAPFKLTTWAPMRYKIEHPVNYHFGEAIQLVGYRVEPKVARPGQLLTVTLYWLARASIPEDYTVFVHLLDASERIIAQHDGPPVDGDYPTSAWDVGETVKDEHAVMLPAYWQGGLGRIVVGLYRRVDGTRLPISNDQKVSVGDHLMLAEIVVSKD